jgi:hypothetical protein
MRERDEIHAVIHGFLAGVRRRLLLRSGLEAAGYGVAGLGVGLLALALTATAVGPASFWPAVTIGFAVALVLAALAFGVLVPARALRGDRAAARRTGALAPLLASDLLSAVELAEAAPDPRAATSPVLIRAFHRQVAFALGPVTPHGLVPLRPAGRAFVAAGAGATLLLAAALVSPLAARGLRTLLHHPSRFEGAAVSTVPVVGDVRVTYTYPPYTGLPPRTVDGSTGDLAAVKGTQVHIETHPLRPARHAALLLGENGSREIPAVLSGDKLTADLVLQDDGIYRFWLAPSFGRAIREERSHRLTAEADAPPRVDIQGPADRLELATPRPIEIGYSASDDFGLGAVDLVYRIGDRPEQRLTLRDGAGATSVQGRMLWDPTSAGGPAGGERIAYRIEARDRDAITGPKVASSRTLYVVIQNPHDGVDDRIERQRDLLERLIADLGDRLESDTKSPGTGVPAAEAAERRIAAISAAHASEEAHLTLLGRLLDEDRREANLGKTLRAALAGIADRLEHALRDEAAALAAVKGKGAAGRARLEAAAARQVTELEGDVLRLDDLIGRERLEDLASLGKELTDAHARLQDLLSRYQKTHDEGLRRQLAREARELRSRIADLAQKIAAVRARNEVPEEWRNMPDMKGIQDQARKLDELLERGNEADLQKALSELGDELSSMRRMLDQNLDGFGAERFPQENRVVADLMKKIGDLEGDERGLQKETQALSEKQEAELQRRMKGQLEELMRREAEKIDRLKQRLAGVPTGSPESALSEEVGRARESATQMRRLLAERDLAEAKAEAERAESSLERAGEHLDELAAARRGRRGEAERDKRAESVSEARGLAQEIADDLAKLMPKGAETMTPEQREAARGQAEKQSAIGKRTDELAEEAARRLGKMPGMERAASDLKGASARMHEAGESLKRNESKPAATAERDAADRLAKLRDGMQERTMGGAERHRDPVRIPGADDSRAPRAWRQELLDAMKEKAPERYRDEVRRYYEELVK